MNSTDIALNLVCKSFDYPMERDSRSHFQYLTYLLQAAGLGLGFHFGWYHRKSGVFCEKFASEFFSCLNCGELKDSLIPQVDMFIFKVKSLLLDKPEGLTLEEWTNLLVNYHFLRDRSSLEMDDVFKHISVGYYCIEKADTSLKLHGFLHA